MYPPSFVVFCLVLPVSFGLLAKMGFDVSSYTLVKKERAFMFLLTGFGGYLLPFILFWTLAYALVYIY